MRIGIPNLIPLFGYLFFGAVSLSMTILFIDKVDSATTGATIFFVVFLLLCYAMLGLLSYRFKVVAMTEKRLIIIMPFRLLYKSFKFDNVENLKWDLWETFKMGDYRKLNILTSSGYRTNISDLEFVNYDSLERRVINKTNLELKLGRKLNIELQQAKYNRWINLLAIVMFVFFFFLFPSGQRESNINLVIQIAIVIITWRLLVRLVQYQLRINANGKKRK